MGSQVSDAVSKPKQRARGVSRGHFWMGVTVLALATIGTQMASKNAGATACPAAQQPTGTGAQAPLPGSSVQTAGKVDTTSPWFYLITGLAGVIFTTWLLLMFNAWAPPKDSAETGIRAEIWLFLAIPTVTMALLGAYMFWKKRNNWVLQRMTLKDLLETAVQLVPGTALAVLGNVLPVDHALVASWWITPSWASMFLGTLVSILLVRKFEMPAKP